MVACGIEALFTANMTKMNYIPWAILTVASSSPLSLPFTGDAKSIYSYSMFEIVFMNAEVNLNMNISLDSEMNLITALSFSIKLLSVL